MIIYRLKEKETTKTFELCVMEDDHEVVLLGFWASPYVMRVKIALDEKGIHYHYLEEEDIFKTKSSLLLKMNPIHKKIPVLLHRGKPICESLIILQYIDDVWKDKTPTLLSDNPHHRAKARFWVDFFDNKIVDCGRRMWASKGQDQEAAKEEFIECLKLLEGELGEMPYLEGENFGLMDVALIPFSCRFYTYEMFCNFSVEKECPKLMEWVRRCNDRESVSKTLPDQYKVYDFVCHVKKTIT